MSASNGLKLGDGLVAHNTSSVHLKNKTKCTIYPMQRQTKLVLVLASCFSFREIGPINT